MGVGGVFVLVLGVNHAKQHHGPNTVRSILLNGLEKNINRLLVDTGHASYGFIHAYAMHDEVRLNKKANTLSPKISACCRPTVDAWPDVHLSSSVFFPPFHQQLTLGVTPRRGHRQSG